MLGHRNTHTRARTHSVDALKKISSSAVDTDNDTGTDDDWGDDAGSDAGNKLSDNHGNQPTASAAATREPPDLVTPPPDQLEPEPEPEPEPATKPDAASDVAVLAAADKPAPKLRHATLDRPRRPGSVRKPSRPSSAVVSPDKDLGATPRAPGVADSPTPTASPPAMTVKAVAPCNPVMAEKPTMPTKPAASVALKAPKAPKASSPLAKKPATVCAVSTRLLCPLRLRGVYLP